MFMFGSYFDSDPQYSWASEILMDTNLSDSVIRVEQLFDATNEYLDVVPRLQLENCIGALQRADKTLDGKALALNSASRNTALLVLHDYFPEASKSAGDEGIQLIFERGTRAAHRYGLTTSKELFLITALTFFFGHRFTEDPLHGNITIGLKDACVLAPEQRSADLYRRTELYLSEVLGDSGSN
jgi:hypothetical protein